jgi:uncharacterized protein GlcG (DUF336 family)
MNGFKTIHAAAAVALGLCVSSAHADCGALPGWGQLKAALQGAVSAEGSGFNLQMWATIVDRDGVVCAVAFSGTDRGAQWPGSRVISAQKANAANAFSLDAVVLSTANLYSAVQPGGSLFGLQHSNPVATDVAYGGDPAQYGTPGDPMTGKRIGGVNVFGGGLALYDSNRKVVGGVGLSGDTSCADHMIAWRVRHRLNLDKLAGITGVSGDPQRPDNIVYDLNPDTDKSAGGWGHPRCVNTANPKNLAPVE